MEIRIQLGRPELLSVFQLPLGIIVLALSLFFFTQLDHIVHVDLYRYGLNFSHE